MLGLLIKDLINLKKNVLPILILVIAYMFLSVTSSSPHTFCAVISIICMMLPVTALAYDERSDWDKYSQIIPLSKKKLVAEKYLLGLILGAAALVINLLFCLIGFPNQLWELFVLCIEYISIGMLYLAFVMPFMFKFGCEKGRLFMSAIILLPVIVLSLIAGSISLDNTDVVPGGILTALIVATPVICAVVFFLSILISAKIYSKKEF